MRVPPLNLQQTTAGGVGAAGGMERLQLPIFSPDLLWRYQLSPFSPPASSSSLPPPSPVGSSHGQPAAAAAFDLRNQLPNQLPPDPRMWGREEVGLFLHWCEREFDLPPIEVDRLRMNGKALCMLNKADLNERAPGAGDVMHNALQLLLTDPPSCRLPASPLTPHSMCTSSASASPSWSHTLCPTPLDAQLPTQQQHQLQHLHQQQQQTASVTLSPASSLDSQCASPNRCGDVRSLLPPGVSVSIAPPGPINGKHSSEDSEDSVDVDSPRRSPLQAAPPSPTQLHHQQLSPSNGHHTLKPPVQCWSRQMPTHQQQHSPTAAAGGAEQPEAVGSGGRLLWDFLQQLLNDPMQRFNQLIAWKNVQTGVFKIVDPQGLARLWGVQKNHLSMNYDKMSRALRYYYRVNILRKVQGERHCYQFLRNPSELKTLKHISLRGCSLKVDPRSPVQRIPPATPGQPSTGPAVQPSTGATVWRSHASIGHQEMPTDLSLKAHCMDTDVGLTSSGTDDGVQSPDTDQELLVSDQPLCIDVKEELEDMGS